MHFRPGDLLLRILHPFRKLQWKLTFTYTFFTVAAVLLLQAIGIFTVRVVRHRDEPFSSQAIVMRLSRDTRRVAPLLASNPAPDTRALAKALNQDSGAPDDLVMPRMRNYTALLNTEGGIVTAVPNIAAVLGPIRSAGGISIVQAALSGKDDLNRLVWRSEDGETMAAAVIRGQDGRIMGALFMVTPRPPGLGGLLLSVLSWRKALQITLIAGLIGALFGFFTARWLTIRLHRMALATEAWGRGDFSIITKDRGQDELSNLARSLNSMAGQFPALLADRERLAVVEERTRLARDLHDSVTQSLYGVVLYAKAAARRLAGGEIEPTNANLGELLFTAEQALREMRLLIFELRPLVLGKEGFAAALQARIESVEERAGLETEFRIKGNRILAPEIEEELYHLAQEALNNVLKHSRARKVAIDLTLDEKSTILEIRDNGAGFDAHASRNGGFGLRGMEERANRIGGVLLIESEPGVGTRIKVEVPR